MGRHFDRGMALYQMERYSGAITEFNEELAEDPECCVTYAMRGASLLNLGQLRSAERDIEYALSIEPEFSYSYFVLSLIKRRQEQFLAAEKAILEALRLGHEPLYFRQLAAILYDQERLKEAVEASREALQLDPCDEMSLVAHGAYLSANGETKAAERVLSEARSMRPDLANAHFAIGMFDIHHQRIGSPMQSLLEARRLAPTRFNRTEPIALAFMREFGLFRLLRLVIPWWPGWSSQKRWILGMIVCTVALIVSWFSWFEVNRWYNWTFIPFIVFLNLVAMPCVMGVVVNITAKHFAYQMPQFPGLLYWRIFATCVLVIAFYLWCVSTFAGYFAIFPPFPFLVLAGFSSRKFFRRFLQMETLVSGLKNLLFGTLLILPGIAGAIASMFDVKLAVPLWIVLLACSYYSDHIFAWLNRPRAAMKFTG